MRHGLYLGTEVKNEPIFGSVPRFIVEQEHVCPRCDFISARRGRCPIHRMKLVAFSKRSLISPDQEAERADSWTSALVLLGIVLLSAVAFSYLH